MISPPGLARFLFALFSSGVLGQLGCGRVPESALRDEQARSRRYRDAYETQAGEVQELRKRLATAEKHAAACTGPAAPPAASTSTAPPPTASAPAASTPAAPTPAAPTPAAPTAVASEKSNAASEDARSGPVIAR